MAHHSLTTDVTDAASFELEVPGADDPLRYDWMTITPIAAAWVSPWGADAVAKGDDCVYIPAGKSRTFRWRSTGVNGRAASGSTSIVVEAWRGCPEDSDPRTDYPMAP